MEIGTESTGATPAPGEDYDVVLLVEQGLTDTDAAQVRSLHEGLDVQVTYHVLLPMTDAAAAVEASLGAIGAVDMVSPSQMPDPEELAALREEFHEQAEHELASSILALTKAGAKIGSTTVVEGSPVDALTETVQKVDGREAIILTRQHLVAEFFHLDWTHRARRKLGVPVLHLLEHETFDEQAGGGEGIEIL
ncbi:hypothetical protein E8D34_12300 [Nocardioides sp. GY 10113]|uniref:hypothetical protein n=1 Tax=Nocardioides sp. GY 10113 TaxID=2569761 RepID=UPI0010A91BEF|nr:hypothetical protein [Nocardioides sp. GY 10113]TIC85881.1 hypothetical protein E8D34_12300 [Nocardioides sp. GY 10113]